MTSFQATLVNTGFGQLLLRDSLGKVAQRWTLTNPKCVIGTGTNCNVSCQLPGISDHHVLMVIGAKQVFLRALAPGLTRHGQNISELVMPGGETEFTFEIAGHHFQFSRDSVSTPVAKEFVQEAGPARPLFAPSTNDAPVIATQPTSPTAINNPAPSPVSVDSNASNVSTSMALVPSRLKFTVVRALEKNRQVQAESPSMIEGGLSTSRPAWVEALVRDALRPVEERLDDLNGPLQNIERRLRRQRAQMRKARKQPAANTDITPSQPQIIPVLAPELIQSQAVLEQHLHKQTSQLDKVTQSVGQIITRLGDVDRQLGTTQAERQELSLQFQQSNQQIATLQREMTSLLTGLQTQLTQPVTTQTSSEARLWQTSVEAQLAELQASLLTLDDIKQTLQAAIEQNRNFKNDWEAQQQKLGELIVDSTQKAVADAVALASSASENIGQVVGYKVCDSLREQLGPRFTNEIAQQLSDSLNNEFALPLTGQLTAQLSEQIGLQLTNQLSAALDKQFEKLPPHVSILPAAQPVAVPLNNEEIIQALRSTLIEVLAPLAGTLHSSLQQSLQLSMHESVQQAVDQSLQQSLEQSVQQTIAPMIEAAAAQSRAAMVMPALQLPNIQQPDAQVLHALRSEAQHLPVAYPSSLASPAVEPNTQSEVAYYEPASQPEQFEVEEHPTYEQVSDAFPAPVAFEQPADTSQGFDSQPYYPPGYESRALATPATDEHSPIPNADSQANDSQAYDAPGYESESYSAEAYANVEQPVNDSHVAELPSWWSDDPASPNPAAQFGVNPINADNDANYNAEQYDNAGQVGTRNHVDSIESPYDSSVLPTGNGQATSDPYAQSAFSAEQLDLGSQQLEHAAAAFHMPQPLEQPSYEEDPYDSVPYSELVNRKPAIDEELVELPDFPSEYSEQGYSASDLVPVGAPDDYAPGAVEDFRPEAFADIAQPEHITQSVPAADNPTVSAAEAKAGEDADESVEDYMRRLLARMRGVSESEVSLPGAEASKPESAVKSKDPSAPKLAAEAQVEDSEGDQISEAWTEPFDPDKYVPRGSAPEKNRDLNALRELANNSARSAIQVSARRRQGSAILIKSTIALVGLIAGIALVSINGARINIAFIATIASFLVAVIWGYDASTSIRPLMQANRHQSNQKRESDKAAADEEAAQ